ncbi:MAG: thioredoxin family protein [Armatimonadota bacterium]|jgi:thiol-disulfide isomerase/thioredoxin
MMVHMRRAAPVLGLVAVCLSAPAALGAEGISWHATLDDALTAAKQSGKLVFVDFFATWCEPCRMLEHHTFPAENVIEAARGYECARVDVDRHPDLATRYGVQGIPNMAFLNADGEVLHRLVGFYPPEPFANVLASVGPLARHTAALREAPDDPRTNYAAAMMYLELQQPSEALPLFEKVLAAAQPGSSHDRRERREISNLRIGAAIGRDACLAVGEKGQRKALKRLERLLKRDPRTEHAALAKWHIAAAYFTMDNYERSAQCGEQLVRQYDGSVWAERAKPLIAQAKQLAT